MTLFDPLWETLVVEYMIWLARTIDLHEFVFFIEIVHTYAALIVSRLKLSSASLSFNWSQVIFSHHDWLWSGLRIILSLWYELVRDVCSELEPIDDMLKICAFNNLFTFYVTQVILQNWVSNPVDESIEIICSLIVVCALDKLTEVSIRECWGIELYEEFVTSYWRVRNKETLTYKMLYDLLLVQHHS